MKITILSLFPEMFTGIFSESILKRAQEDSKVSIEIINFRDFSLDKHKKVDDYAFGGGPGMLLSVEPIYNALISIEGYFDAWKILLTPQGIPYHQEVAKKYALKEHLILICGHYEGFDERIRAFVDEEVSIGDFVLTGGEIAAMTIIDSVVRLLPDVLGSEESFTQDSFYEGLLEYPQYTRPQEFMGIKVPDVLISGNHQEIEKWRKEESLKRTKERRPDLLQKTKKKD
ncbi:MAG: tRNA (guanosine(37)-N1)-methyltransferase TrmD [Firmicutes bacterium]|nr:tRNA (guanosine(37)-N1)-methyltransferase TrmD [Bacillota bacterium]